MLKFDIANVVSFRDFDVRDGEVVLADDEYADHLDECYGNVEVCGYSYGAGRLLKEVDPTAFRCGKSDYESEIESELETQLENLDDSDIEFDDEDLPETLEDIEAGNLEPLNQEEDE